MSEDAAVRLGRLIRERRKALKLTQAEVQARGGPSTATLRVIEGGKHIDFRPATAQPLESVLEWQAGSIAVVLEGGEPTPIARAYSTGSGSTTATVEPGPPRVGGYDHHSLSEVIAAYVETHDLSALQRAQAMADATVQALTTVRNVLMHASEQSVRAEAIDALNPAVAAANFLRDVIGEMTSKAGEHNLTPYELSAADVRTAFHVNPPGDREFGPTGTPADVAFPAERLDIEQADDEMPAAARDVGEQSEGRRLREAQDVDAEDTE
jgi:hypothetical protein